ncbi:acyltransferase family protein [Enterobacter bugandensis]|uniref:acyltransferase family protein n=1 Tax=Enterobacter bugandensis TaxID=881260 RepID=UPI002361F01C|nr:acyltransferase family protein [Enterobacter bugandensis]
MHKRSEIDGLRAIAVIPVILNHAGWKYMPGGFAGVDVFFVISGFLITSMLLENIQNGQPILTDFWLRRARRILPALFFMLMIVTPFAWAWLMPEENKHYWKSLVAVCLFLSNVFFSHEINYFSRDAELNPLLHTWSLAVEEQFYLIYPVLFIFIIRFGKKLGFTGLLILALLSFFCADYASRTYSASVYYNSLLRFWELLAGSCAAFYFHSGFSFHKNTILSSLAGLVGLTLILLAYININKYIPFPGRYTLLPVIGSVLFIIFSNAENIPGKILSSKLLVFTGLISYSLYLWHQPVLALARNLYPTGVPESVIIVLFFSLFTMSCFSWRYIEQPFRSRHFLSVRQIMGLGITVPACFIIVAIIGINTNLLNRFYDENYLEMVKRMHFNYGLSEHCDSESIIYGACQTSPSPEILLWGDSYAMHVAGMITASNPGVKMLQTTFSQCPPVVGVANTNTFLNSEICINKNDKVLEVLRHNKSIKYVVLASAFERLSDNGGIIFRGGTIKEKGSQEYRLYFMSTVDKIKRLGKIPVIISPPPKNRGYNTGLCLERAILTGEAPYKCNFDISHIPPEQQRVYQYLSELSDRVRVISLKNYICNDGKICQASVNGRLIYLDQGHISQEGSQLLGERLDIYRMITRSSTTPDPVYQTLMGSHTHYGSAKYELNVQ